MFFQLITVADDLPDARGKRAMTTMKDGRFVAIRLKIANDVRTDEPGSANQ
jgi:hypothetical protein